MRAQSVVDFKQQEEDPYKTLGIGTNAVGGPVTDQHIFDMLLDISKDYQFDLNDENYMGFINLDIADFDPRTQDYMREYLIRWNDPIINKYMDSIGIYLQSADSDGEEIIFASTK